MKDWALQDQLVCFWFAERQPDGESDLAKAFHFQYVYCVMFGSFAFSSFRLLILYFLIYAFTALCPIVCLKEMQKLPEAVHLIEKASMMYLENGTPDTGRHGPGAGREVSVDRGSALGVFLF